MPPALTAQEIRRVARTTIATLAGQGLESCLFGSAACAIYGMTHRVPNDVDLVVLEDSLDPEEIKDMIVSANNNFYLVPAANPRNTYNVLWYYLPRNRRCKVDILTPGLLSIPDIPPENVVRVDQFQDIPVTPLLPLLLLKLRGWTDHMEDPRRWMQEKASVDEEDIDELLELAVDDYDVHLDDESDWLPNWFIEEARERVDEYVQAWPDSEDYWSQLGF
ncbi:hypothetical protein H0H81_009936 [Sphagnurus paluster]|uniref:Uncharacterized protein n=1 Tax=Sphagnurus paluster TaxID=117069 RepID=A0A9P7GVM4_9AGAR|nr:hypothetical protein H0H81_009936 [Sphagnurus paluster]